MIHYRINTIHLHFHEQYMYIRMIKDICQLMFHFCNNYCVNKVNKICNKLSHHTKTSKIDICLLMYILSLIE